MFIILGGGFPILGLKVIVLVVNPPSLDRSMNSFNSLPFPPGPEAITIGFLNLIPRTSTSTLNSPHLL